MKRTSKELKRISRDILNGRYNIPMGVFATASLIPTLLRLPFSLSANGGFSADSGYASSSGYIAGGGNIPQAIVTLLAEFIILLVAQVLQAGAVQVHLNMTRAEEFKIVQMFNPFRFGAERYFGAALLESFLTILCCLPLMAGTIYFYVTDITASSIAILCAGGLLTVFFFALLSLNYQFVPYFLLDYPQMKVIAAFQECRRMMGGNKRRLLYVLLSFAGYMALVLCSFGIAALWASPYMTQTLVAFYLDCTGELDRIPVPQQQQRWP